MSEYSSGSVRADYGVNLGHVSANLIGGPGGVEQYGINKIEQIDKDIKKQMEIINAINELKAAFIQAKQSGDTLNLKTNKNLKAALKLYNEMCPEPLDFMPKNGVIPREEIHDILLLLSGQLNSLTTNIEVLMMDVSRVIYDQQAMHASAKEILKDWIEAVRLWIRNSKVQ